MSPRKKSPDSKSATLSVRMRPEQKLEIGARAKAAGLLTSEYMVRSALGEVFAGAPRDVGSPPAPEIPGQVTVEEALIGEEPVTVVDDGEVTVISLPAVDPVVKEEVAAEVAEARMPDPESRQAFIDRRALQLHGQGATKPVARMKAAQEWEER